MRLKVSTAKWRLFCLGINVLKGRDYHLPFFHKHWFYSNGFGCANKQSLTFRSPWDVAVILKVHFSNSLYRTLACEIAPRWMPQNITYKISSVNGLVLADPACLQLGQVLCHHMGSLGHNESIYCNLVLYALRQCYVMSPIIAKFCFASSLSYIYMIIPDFEAIFMVTGFTTRDKKYIDVPILANL